MANRCIAASILPKYSYLSCYQTLIMKELLFVFLGLVINLQFSYAQIPFNTPDNIGAGNCLDFDGSNDRLNIGSIGDLGTAYTVELWAMFPTLPAAAGFVMLYGTNDQTNVNNLAIDVEQFDSRISFNVRDNSGTNARATSPSGTLSTNTWYHIVGVRNGNTVTLYVNGDSLRSSTATFGTVLMNQLTLGAGYHDGGNTWVSHALCQIDEVRIWNTARTEMEIKNNMCKVLQGNETGLVGYWNMNRGESNTCSPSGDVCDLTGNGNHGVLQQ